MAVRGGAAKTQNHPQRLRRKAGAQTLWVGALIRAAERWRGLRFTEFELRQIAVRKELDQKYEDEVTLLERPSQPRVSSKSAP
jgi:hypothetical protein